MLEICRARPTLTDAAFGALSRGDAPLAYHNKYNNRRLSSMNTTMSLNGSSPGVGNGAALRNRAILNGFNSNGWSPGVGNGAALRNRATLNGFNSDGSSPGVGNGAVLRNRATLNGFDSNGSNGWSPRVSNLPMLNTGQRGNKKRSRDDDVALNAFNLPSPPSPKRKKVFRINGGLPK